MKISISTQVLENYGAHTWDGNGECPSAWKAKGGAEYIVENYEFSTAEQLQEDAERLSALLECNDDYYQINVINWELVEDDYIPYCEQQELDYEGVIRYYAPLLSLEGVVSKKFFGYDNKLHTSTYDLNEELAIF